MRNAHVRPMTDRACMFETEPAPAPTRLRYPVMIEIAILGGIGIVLIVSLGMIQGLVTERSERAKAARAEIASGWGAQQTVGGPVLVIPYRVRTDATTVVVQRARFLPSELKVTGKIYPERRHRGIYETVLYSSDLAIEGAFARPDFSGWNIAPEDILWNEAFISLELTDLRGIRGNPLLRWNGQPLPIEGGGGDTTLWSSGIHSSIPTPGAERDSFTLSLHLNGSETISFLPMGGETQIEIASPWPNPSFCGAFLPDSRTITPGGFRARWSVSSMARSFPQRWRTAGDDDSGIVNAIGSSAFGVGLFSPVGHYQKTERSVKYGALFIVLTFLTFFLYELLSPVTLHPVHYLLVGGALCLFYLLLLSFSEQVSFAFAYAIASIATIALISCYSAVLLRSRRRLLGLIGVMALLYGYLYVLLQLEDWALLMGSIGLFAILAGVMYATRNVDWGSAHTGGKTAAAQ